ncbi:MAG TPA: hypothetical protein VMM13_13965, partial [Euzebya sp.]|nr:hypothetical protein [Euzebya sp.]
MRTLTHALHRSEEGSALIVIMAISGVLSLLVGASFALARQSIQIADEEEETHGALAAAEAGLDDYLFRLNTVDNYWQYGAAADGMPPPPDDNDAFEGFVPVPGGASPAEYTYRIDTNRLATERILVLTSTGRAEGRERSISATLKQSSFLDYVYFTDFETIAPSLYFSDPDRQWAQDNCSVHRWETERPTTGLPSNPSRGCSEIYWVTGDVVDGPFHTNDRFRLGGDAIWLESASNSDPRDPSYDRNGHNPTFAVPGDPRYEPVLSLPPNNTAIKLEADFRTGGEGCLFTGPTDIRLRADGRLRVTSPYTRRSGTGCGAWTDGLDGPQVIDIPDNGVVYVQAIPEDPTDPNHVVGCPAGNGNGLGYPAYADDVWSYSCRDGDVFVEGTLDGRLTIASQHDVIITWHRDYAGTDDMLGLVANDYVAVYHPVSCSTGQNTCPWFDNALPRPNHNQLLRTVRINAAVLSVNGSFMVQTWYLGHRPIDRCQPLDEIQLR